MILTGPEVIREWTNRRIVIDPFEHGHVNPNSYNFRLGSKLLVYRDAPLDPKRERACETISIEPTGYVLTPGRLFLGSTLEVLGSKHYVPTFSARSSVARLGLFINLSASLGDIGYIGQWTLQLYAVQPLRIYPGMQIGQMMWWVPKGEVRLYNGKYQGALGPQPSLIHKDMADKMSEARGVDIDVTP